MAASLSYFFCCFASLSSFLSFWKRDFSFFFFPSLHLFNFFRFACSLARSASITSKSAWRIEVVHSFLCLFFPSIFIIVVVAFVFNICSVSVPISEWFNEKHRSNAIFVLRCAHQEMSRRFLPPSRYCHALWLLRV